MLSIDLVRQNPDQVRNSLNRRHEDADVVDVILDLDSGWRKLVDSAGRMRATRNEESKAIGELMKQGKRTEAEASRASVRAIGDDLRKIEDEAETAQRTLREHLLRIPNLVSDQVPDGEDESGNIVVSVEGVLPTYEFPLKPHWELSEALGVTDFERGAKISGRMFYVLGETGARLQRALVRYMIDLHRNRHGYSELSVPYLVLGETMLGAGNLPKFADALYHDTEEDLWLIPTAEVPITGLHRDEILDSDLFPIRYMAHTPCFRREKASAGSNVRGLMRVHQFEKVEMYQLVHPDRSDAALNELIEHASDVLRGLGLVFHVLQLCSGDLSFPSTKSYDLEAWAPASHSWLEVSSCSNCTDFQSRRSNIRFRSSHNEKSEFVHTLNGSGLALPRILIAILENFQKADGSVVLPQAIVPYMDGQEVLEPVR